MPMKQTFPHFSFPVFFALPLSTWAPGEPPSDRPGGLGSVESYPSWGLRGTPVADDFGVFKNTNLWANLSGFWQI